MLKEAADESCTLRRFIKHFDPNAHVRIYENMHEQKKRWISPLVLSDEDYADKWLAEAQAECALKKNTFPKETEYQTMNGELVRSKSEKMLADGFYSFGVRYVYEPAVTLSDGTVFSDFLALNQRTRVAKYVEHFGMMDKPEYAADAVRKIKRYEKSGFFLGDLLVVTWETSLSPLGTNEIEAMIRKHFL